MRCRTCGGDMVQKSRLRLSAIGLLMTTSIAIVFRFAWFWVPAILLIPMGIYLLVWATLGRGYWCRSCKKISLF